MRALVIALVMMTTTPYNGIAGDFAGDDRVSEWRRSAQRIGTDFSIGYAAGVMAVSNTWFWCKNPATVGELEAYLKYGATPTDTLRQALVRYMSARGCTFKDVEAIKADMVK